MDEDLDFDSILAEIDMEETLKNDNLKENSKLDKSKNTENSVNLAVNSVEDELKAMKAKVAELELRLSTQKQETDGKKKSLMDIDLFNKTDPDPSSLQQKSQMKINSQKELQLSLFGYESSDEESGKYPLEKRGLNDYGKFVKSKLPPSRNPSPKSQIQPANKSVAVNSKANRNIEKEFYSGLRIINPIISSSVMKEKMEGRRLIRMSQIQNFTRGGEIDGDWVTIGVIISKADPKVSSKGKTYSIWRMNDLRDCSKIVSFFLFGNIHKTHWKTPVGSVVGILNASSMPSKDNVSSKYANELSFVIDHQDKVMILGQSKDLGTCLGRRKDGARCSSFVNKDVCEFCPFHIQSAYKKMSSKRTDLQMSYSGAEPSGLRKKIFQNQQIFYGGQSFTGSASTNTRKGLNLESLRLQRNAQNMQNDFLKSKGKHLTQNEKNVVGNISSQSEAFGEMMTMPTVGSRNLMKHILTDKTKPETSTLKSVSASDLLKLHKKEFEAKSKSRLANNSPQLSSAETIPLEFIERKLPQMSRSEIAKMKAAQIIKRKGSIEKINPNAITAVKSPSFIERVKDKIEKKSNPKESGDSNHSTKKLCTKNDEFEKVLKAKSIHSDSFECEENEKYFNEMETKEKIETQATTIQEIACKVVSCKKCQYTAFSASELCKTENHPLKIHSAMKRFFSCKNCKRRTVSINKLPTTPCTNCGEKNYERTGMKRERTGPKLDNEMLSIRGDESKFLNSFDTKGLNINL